MLCPLCKCTLPDETLLEQSSSRRCVSCGATLDQYFIETESVAIEKIGRFTLLKVLGEGGFGTVYQAKDTALDRMVALKVIRASKLGSIQMEARLVREAKAASLLNHAGIVKVFDLVENGPFKVLIEEYVEGDTLDSLLKKNKLTTKQCIEIVVQLADALAYAHDCKVVHRDVKPANIMIDAFNKPRILDFGLAKREGMDESMTEEGQLLGTMVYMSPEQANGQVSLVGEASDQYSLGVILYLMLTGELPFRGSGNMVLRQIVLDEPPHPRSLNDSIPRDLENICLKAMAKKINDRYVRISAFAEDLKRFQKAEPVVARPVGLLGKLERWSRRNRTLAYSLAAVSLILILGTVISTYFAFKSFNDLQGRIKAEQQSQKSQLQLLLEGDASEIRPVIQSFRTNLNQFESELTAKQEQVKDEPRKLARVLLTQNERHPELNTDLFKLMLRLPPPDSLLVHDFIHTAPSAELMKELWQTVLNRQISIPQRLIATVALGKSSPNDSRWKTQAKYIVEDLLNPLSTVHLPLWLQHLQPISSQLQTAWQAECWNQKDKQRATIATTFFLQLYGKDPRAVSALLAALPVNNVPLVIHHMKEMKFHEQLHSELKLLTRPEASREPLIAMPSSLPLVPDMVRQQIKAAGGMVQESFAICAALPWPDLQPVLHQMSLAGYRPTICRPYSTVAGLRVAVIWYRDQQPGTTHLTEMAIDLEDSSLRKREEAARLKGFTPIELAAYEVEPKPGEREIRYIWIERPDINQSKFRVQTKIPEDKYLKENQSWLLASNSVFHRTGILDQEKGVLPILTSTTRSSENSLAFTQVIRSIPSQHGQDSYAPSFAYALSDDKFRLTLASFNIHHDVTWVPPLPRQNRQQYFRSMLEKARQLKEAQMESSVVYADLLRAAYELNQVSSSKLDLPSLARKENSSDSVDWFLALTFARQGEVDLCQQCMARYINRKSTDWRYSAYLQSATSLLLKKPIDVNVTLKAFEQVIGSAPDGLSKLLHAKLLCLAASLMNDLNPQRSHYLNQACDIAKVAITHGEGPGYEIEEWWSCEFELIADKLEPLIQKKRAGLRYAVTWSPARGIEQQIQHGETIDLALPVWQRWSEEGYVPHLISAIEWDGKARIISAWRRARPLPEEEMAVAVRRAHAILVMAYFGDTEPLWTALNDASLENLPVTLANELIFRCRELLFDPTKIAQRFLEPSSPLLKHRLLLAMGQYPLADYASVQPTLLKTIGDVLLTDPDSGVHSACNWLLRQWKQDHVISNTWKGNDMTIANRGDRKWYRSVDGQEYALFLNPQPFFMGLSPDDGEASVPYRERPHMKRIGHSFALATKEVSKSDFLEFKKDHETGERRFSPSDDCPIGNVPWMDAALYCNMLSEKAGIPKEQWCYLVNSGTNQVVTAPDYLLREGYRLPLESEFEYACRGSSRLIRFFGNSPNRIGKYAWYSDNASRQLHPIGTLPPNPWGLFDMYGNASEWLNDLNRYYPETYGQEIAQDQFRQLAVRVTTANSNVVVRSLSWGADAMFIRTSQRSNRPINATTEAVDLGFRVARTIKQ